MKVLGVYRESRFSPGKIEDDAAILDRTAERLRRPGVEVRMVRGEDLERPREPPALVFSMCQGSRALEILDRLACPVVNPVAAIRNCFRTNLLERLDRAGIPQPRWKVAGPEFPESLGVGPWLKRGDVHAMEAGDVRRIVRKRDWTEAFEGLRQRGISAAIAQEHREGAVFKFYGVAGGFFRAFGLAAGREGDAFRLAVDGARALGLSVYGGDGVCRAGGTLSLIDFNDWPSFSRCRDDAAAAIATYLISILSKSNPNDLIENSSV